MNDILALIVYTLWWSLISGLTYMLWLYLVKSTLLRRLPFPVFTTIWLICLLGILGVVDLPHTFTVSSSGWIAIPDFVFILLFGVPIMIGFPLGWIGYKLLLRHEKINHAEGRLREKLARLAQIFVDPDYASQKDIEK